MIEATERSFVVGREELAPLSVEMHYFRVPKRYWSICFERIKRAGFRIISTQIPWNVHEVMDGRFDFVGFEDPARDLTVFLELAREFGFKVVIRPGPWLEAEWPAHGLPEYILDHRDLLAQDREGVPLTAASTAGEKPGKVPSYLHPVYISAVKRYFQALSEVIRNYVYPRGPIFMIELDGRPFLGGNECFRVGDHNSAATEHLGEFLEYFYPGGIKELNSTYKSTYKSFEEVAPPETKEGLKKPEQLVPWMDWQTFQANMIDQYIQVLKEIWVGLDAEPFFVYEMGHHGPYSLPLSDRSGEDPAVLPSISVDWSQDFYTMLFRLRTLTGLSPFPLSLRFACGHYSPEPDIKSRYDSIGQDQTKFLMVAALASGLKMLNAYMFVNRDRWYGGAVGVDGTVGPSYEPLQKLEQVLEQLPVPALRQDIQVGFGVPREYVSYTLLGEEPLLHPVLHRLLGETIPALHKDCTVQNLAVAATDFSVAGPWQAWPVLIVPGGPFMDAEVQESLVAAARAGQQVLIVGEMPLVDSRMKSCQVLARAAGARTYGNPGVIQARAFDLEFPAYHYGFVRATGAQRTVTAGQKTLGCYKKVERGSISLLCFDPATRGDATRQTVLAALLKSLGEEPVVRSSDPGVHLFLNKFEKYAVLYLVAPPTSAAVENGKPNERDVIIQADLARVKLRGKNLKMVELFGGETIKTTVKDLKTGIVVRVKDYTSYAWWLERKA
jgi:beta-galactosidase